MLIDRKYPYYQRGSELFRGTDLDLCSLSIRRTPIHLAGFSSQQTRDFHSLTRTCVSARARM